jgi:hypothetical protein
VLTSDEKILIVAGNFQTAGGESHPYIAAIETSSNKVTNWNPRPNGQVKAVTTNIFTPGVVYAAGDFDEIGSTKTNNYVAIDLISGLVTSWNPYCTWWLVLLIIQILVSTVYYFMIPKKAIKFWWLVPVFLALSSWYVDLSVHRYYIPSAWCHALIFLNIIVSFISGAIYIRKRQ